MLQCKSGTRKNEADIYRTELVSSPTPDFAATTAGANTIPMKASAISRSCILLSLSLGQHRPPNHNNMIGRFIEKMNPPNTARP